ncbi:MAG: DUF3365 domain-containing protein [bacterium]
MKTSTRISLIQIAGLLLASGVLILAVRHSMRSQALEEARKKARILLDANLAVHAYFTHQLKPQVGELASETVGQEYFDPVWMSSTYAVRQITGYFRELHPAPYSYKESAIDARSPFNEADAYERAFLEQLNERPELEERSAVREIDGRPHLQVLRRGETMIASCLRCHTEPELAPEEMVERYGAERSFDRALDETVSAVSIRIPLADAFAGADRFTWKAAAVVLGVLALFWGGNSLAWSRWVVKPLEKLRRNALRIADSDVHLGEQITVTGGPEFRDLADSFNLMSTNLQASYEALEARVAKRTEELQEANGRLKAEIEERLRAESEKETVIEQLKTALAEVKTLSGLLPICSNCKKIRDDEGYWNQIEEFVGRHSDARFSHSICPECMKELYPGFGGKKE